MSNQKRRLKARGGRRQSNIEYVTQVSFYSPINTATGGYSKHRNEKGEIDMDKQKFLAYQRLIPAAKVKGND